MHKMCGFTSTCACAKYHPALCFIQTFCSIQWLCMQTSKALIRLRGCAGWPGPSLSAYTRRYVFAWRGPINELKREKTYLLTCASNEDSNQPAHPRSLIRVFIVRMRKLFILGYPKWAQWRIRSDCVNAQADLNLRLAHISEVMFSDVATHMWFDNNIQNICKKLINSLFLKIQKIPLQTE